MGKGDTCTQQRINNIFFYRAYTYPIVADKRREIGRLQFVQHSEKPCGIQGVDGRVAAARKETHLQQRGHCGVLLRLCVQKEINFGNVLSINQPGRICISIRLKVDHNCLTIFGEIEPQVTRSLLDTNSIHYVHPYLL